MKNILMIDLETTGSEPGCKVLSLGAFGFNHMGQQVEFYVKFRQKPQVDAGLTDDADTMAWWSRQDPAIAAEAFSGNTEPAEGIADFKQWFYKNFSTGRLDGFQVWSCGIDFDFPILKTFFKVFGVSFPWKFWTQYDYRTIKNLFDTKRAEGNVAAHNALEDCKAQMRGLRSFYMTHIDKA